MRYSLLSAVILAFTSSVFAQDATINFDEITAPTEGQQLVAGKPFEITWLPGTKPEYLNGTATIHLLQGSTTKDLQVGPLIVAGAKNSLGKYTWTVPADATYTLYGLRITLDDDKSTAQNEATIFQYSFPFQISKTAASGTVTVTIGTGTAYTPDPTTTSTLINTVSNTSSSIMTSTSASAFPTNSANATITTATRASATATSASTTPATITGAASANVVSGGLLLVGGFVLAFAL